MAAVKRGAKRFPQTEFTIPLVDVINDLILPPDRGPAGATWHFQVDGTTLRLTRIDPAEDVP